MHTPFDVVLVAIYCVVWVAVATWQLPHTRAWMTDAAPGARSREYVTIMAAEWALAFAVLGRLMWTATPIAEIGLRLPRGILGWAVTAAGLALTLWLLRLQDRGTKSERGRASIRRQLAHIAWFMPRERREFAAFSMLSLTAGVCEEILFRGHLMAFFDSLTWPVLGTLAAVVLFAIGHAYQGPGGVVRVAVIGMVMALVYRGSGSLIAPIVMHALIDWRGGKMVESVVSVGGPFEGTARGEAGGTDARAGVTA